MRFAELLLSAEAELELGLVGAAEGVSVLQRGEGVAGVAVRDEAEVVPGGGETDSGTVKAGTLPGTI